MRLKISKSKNASSLYVIKSIYKNGKRTSKIVEKLGTYAELQEQLNGIDPIEWAKEYIEKLNKETEKKERTITIQCSTSKLIAKDENNLFNGGYIFLQKIYYELGLDKICNCISNKYKFEFNLDSILSRLIYGRIIFPSSKLGTSKLSEKFIEKPKFKLHHIYRALEIIAKESAFLQSELYKNSLKISKRNTGILYYDCTNYFFEIEEEEGLKQYGVSKEHRPNPIVQMGLFMDGNGVPLAFNINKGNTNEQITLKPLEEQIIKDFELSKFIVCTDAGLASNANRQFNNLFERAFITTQSIKKLKKKLKDWAISKDGWRLLNENKIYNIDDLEKNEEYFDKYYDKIFYKEQWIKENDLEQKIIVTYSLKYKSYQENIRNNQIERAKNLIKNNPQKLRKTNANDYKRFIIKTSVTKAGEIADKDILSINDEIIKSEAIYDGLYAVCTNLDDNISEIIKINQRRWEIEESFRIMKTEFKARPVYLSRDDRIEAHFTTCFISLMIYRYLEKRLDEKFTVNQIIDTLKNMNFFKVTGDGYIPTYTRTDLTDAIHDKFGFRTDYQIVTNKEMKKILISTKSK